MKIVVLGGAGEIGSRAVEDLAGSEGVSDVTIADRNVTRAREIADAIESPRAQIHVTAVDANVKDSLVAVMRGHDVAASALGPFHRYETKLVSAALEAEVDYVSLCDEPEPTQKVFDKFSREAAEQGRVVLIGLGQSPGITNIAFEFLAEGMEKVERADICCYQPLNAGGRAVLQHLLHIINGKMSTWRRGKRQRIPCLSEEKYVDLPTVGSVPVWNTGHSEPVTLPRTRTSIRDVNFMLGFGTGGHVLVHLARWGVFNSPSRIDAAVAVITRVESWLGASPASGAFRIDVEGIKDGKPARDSIFGEGRLRDLAGVTLSIGAQLVATRQLLCEGGGVFAPEGCVSPKQAIAALARRGIALYHDIELKIPVVGAG